MQKKQGITARFQMAKYNNAGDRILRVVWKEYYEFSEQNYFLLLIFILRNINTEYTLEL